MAKRLGILSKSLESKVSVQAEAKNKLWDAVPMMVGENLKSWFPRAARVLTQRALAAGFKSEDIKWTPRRVRALYNNEARRIDHLEIKLLEMQKGAQRRREILDELQSRRAELRSSQASRNPAGGSVGASPTSGGSDGAGEGRIRTD